MLNLNIILKVIFDSCIQRFIQTFELLQKSQVPEPLSYFQFKQSTSCTNLANLTVSSLVICVSHYMQNLLSIAVVDMCDINLIDFNNLCQENGY